jgi:hypothetical protein
MPESCTHHHSSGGQASRSIIDPIARLNGDTRSVLLLAYLAAVAESWPAAWSEATSSVLNRSAGRAVLLAPPRYLSADRRRGPEQLWTAMLAP